ncbi:MAG: sensor histidine kinase [Vampirovibrionia bacterium]
MKKDLLISLCVMVLLTVIVGFSAYNLISKWSELPNSITKTIAKELILAEISSSILSEVKSSEIYSLKPTDEVKKEIETLEKSINEHFNSLKYININLDQHNIQLIKLKYDNNIKSKIDVILNNNEDSTEKEKIKNEITSSYGEILKLINSERSITSPRYQQEINNLKDYSRNVTIVITSICVLLGVILMGISVTHVGTLYEKIENQAKLLENNLKKIKHINKELITSNELNIRIQESERLRIAHDLHDESIQGLINLIRLTGETDKDTNIEYLNKELNTITSQIRNICQNLRPSILDDLGLHSALEWLIDDVEKYGTVPHYEINSDNEFIISKNTELMIFRIIQELINNVKKHSNARNVWVKINYNNDGMTIKMEDDGIGFNYDELNLNKTLGMAGINARLKNILGTIEIKSIKNEGTKIKIFIPKMNENETNEEKV